VLAYHGGSLVKGLIHLFPEIGLDVSKFAVMPRTLEGRRRERKGTNDTTQKTTGVTKTTSEDFSKTVQL
jgi:hypothetical protein